MFTNRAAGENAARNAPVLGRSGGVGVRPKPTVAACKVAVLPSADYRLLIS